MRPISPPYPSHLQVNLSVLGLLCLGGNFSFEAARLVLMQVDARRGEGAREKRAADGRGRVEA